MLAHAIAGEVSHGQVAKAINNLMLWITSIGLNGAGQIAESTGIAAAAFPRMCGTVHKAIGCLTSGRVFSDVRSPAQLERMETQMSDPAHLRAKAQLCSAIAELMSNPADANTARQTAEQYASLAEKAERERAGQQGVAMRSAGRASG